MSGAVERSSVSRESVYESDTGYEESARSDSSESEEINEEELLRSTEELDRMERSGNTPNSDLTDADRLRALDEVSENSDEEAPETPAGLFTAYLKKHGQKDITEEKVKKAMQAAGLKEEDLNHRSFPSSTPEKNKKVFDFLKSINPVFARIAAEHANNPFVDEVRTNLSENLEALSSEAVVSPKNLDKVLEDAVDLPWPGSSETDRQLGIDHGGAPGNGLNANAQACLQALREASQSGTATGGRFGWESDGLNWDRGNFGNGWRRGLGALYGALGKDKTLFKAFLKTKVPETALRSIYAGFKPGGHHNSLPGDLLTTPEIITVLEEIFETSPAR